MSNTQDGNVTTEPVHDLYLRMLIRMLEHDGSSRSSMSITLSTNGGVVSGHLITRDVWKSLWSDQLKGATGTGVEALSTFPDDLDAAIDGAVQESGAEPPKDDGLRYFVHLKNATLFVPGVDRIGFPLWRGRLDSVTGWSLGTAV